MRSSTNHDDENMDVDQDDEPNKPDKPENPR
jgi:hypothetical protein